MKKTKNKKVKETKEDSSYDYWLPLGMCIGISVGTGLGVSTNNMPLCLSTGLTIGVLFGLIMAESKKGKK